MNHTATHTRRTQAWWLTLAAWLLIATRALAQDVIVTVTPVQQVLPPQLLLYISDPGKYFNVSITNTSAQQQDVYLALQLQQVLPSSGLSISTPARRQPSRPFSVAANSTHRGTLRQL